MKIYNVIVTCLVCIAVSLIWGSRIGISDGRETLFTEIFQYPKVLIVVEPKQTFYEIKQIPLKKADKYRGQVRHYKFNGEFITRYLSVNRMDWR